MARIFITGSTDGLGRAAARTLVEEGHEVVLHARRGNARRRSPTSPRMPQGSSSAISAAPSKLVRCPSR